MLRWTSLVLGAAAFLAAHAVEIAMWTAWFDSEWRPFFMNSGRAAAFSAACLLIAGLIAGVLASDRREALIHAGNVAAGAAVVMAAVILWDGPGSLFPIAIVFGTCVLAVSSYLGALLTWPFKARNSRTVDIR